MSRNKDNNKKKIKRKKGKKFVYRNPNEDSVKKVNPFEEMSKKKLIKQGKKYDNVREEFQTKNISNTFIDRRIGEHSKNLSNEEKMKLRFKAQQILNMKKKKDKFSLNNLDKEEDSNFLTHKGKKINEIHSSDDDFEESDDEMYDKLDNYMNQIENAPDTKLSRKEIIQNIIEKSKLMKLEKQNLKRKNQEQTKMLDENFAEISELIARRPRSIGRLNDDFERMANSYNYLDKTKPTDRIKSDKEIEMEKENEIKKKLKQQIREDTDKDNKENHDENSEDMNDHPDKIAQQNEKERSLTKKERIIKLMEKRLNKSMGKNQEDENNNFLKKKRKRVSIQEKTDDGDEDQDNLSDLEEFDKKNSNSNNSDIEEEEKDYGSNEEGDFDDEEEGEYDQEDPDNEEGEFDEEDDDIDEDKE